MDILQDAKTVNFVLDVVVPVRMPSEHLAYFLAEVKNMPSDIRIIFALDYQYASSDNIHYSKSGAENMIFIRGEFGSPGLARNAAFHILTAPYICFWDIDDRPLFHETMKLIEKMKQLGAQVGIGNWAYHDLPKSPKGVLPLDVGSSPGIWRFIFNRELIKDLEFGSFKWGEDQLFLSEVFAKKPTVTFIDNIIYQYRRNTEGSLTSSGNFSKDLYGVALKGAPIVYEMKGSARGCFSLMYLKQIATLIKRRRIDLAAHLLLISIFKFSATRLSIWSIIRLYAGANKW